ncbi:MAG: sigma-70 family RNA polymerase sigma factor [Bacteroidetes bacterium]|nr:sigma-70 family RNA polymerase sigma factor [Bacteroidota bacterium]
MSETQFLEQIKQNQGIIYKLVALYANDTEEKKDLYQEVLLQAWKSYTSFRNDSKLSTWLYRICLNTILTLQRKQNKVDYKDSLEQIAPSIENKAIENEDKIRLRQAIRKLSETDRAIISMNLDGYENAEIADVLGVSNNHIAVKLHRIKQQLGNFLKQ